jgi:hypothetical protein
MVSWVAMVFPLRFVLDHIQAVQGVKNPVLPHRASSSDDQIEGERIAFMVKLGLGGTGRMSNSHSFFSSAPSGISDQYYGKNITIVSLVNRKCYILQVCILTRKGLG